MIDYDRALLDSVRTHRDRLAAAFVHGAQRRRHPVNSNVRRLMGSVILAAVACAACLGTGFVLNIISTQKETAAITAFRQAMAGNPIPESETLVRDEKTGFLRDARNGRLIDPRTGFVVDEATGLATDPQGRTVDPRTGWYVDARTGHYTDPASGITIDPATLEVVEQGQDGSGR